MYVKFEISHSHSYLIMGVNAIFQLTTFINDLRQIDLKTTVIRGLFRFYPFKISYSIYDVCLLLVIISREEK